MHSPLMECMGSLTELLGNSPRVAIIETFAEQPELEFSVPEIVKQTGVSKRGAYLHIAKLLEEGIIAKGKKTGKCQYFRVNEHDRRGEFLGVLESVFTLGRVEREVKRDREIPPEEPLLVQANPQPTEFDYILSSDVVSPDRLRYHDTWTSVWAGVSAPKHLAILGYLEAFVSSGTTANEAPPLHLKELEPEIVEKRSKKLQLLAH